MTIRSLSLFAVAALTARPARAEPPLQPEPTDVADDKIEATLGQLCSPGSVSALPSGPRP